MKRCAFLLSILMLQPLTAAAADDEWRTWPMGERLEFSLGWYDPDIDTSLQISEVGGIDLNNPVDLEGELGFDKNDQTIFAEINWRMFKRHQLDWRYFALDRNATKVIDTEITIGDTVYPIGTDVTSKLDITVYEFAYAFSVVFTEKTDFTVGAGISGQDFDFAIAESSNGGLRETSSFFAPLPTLNIGYDYALTDKWILRAGGGWLDVGYDKGGDDVDGRIIRYNFGVKWRVFKNFAAALDYSVFDVEVDYDDDKKKSSFDYKYNGPLLTVSASF